MCINCKYFNIVHTAFILIINNFTLLWKSWKFNPNEKRSVETLKPFHFHNENRNKYLLLTISKKLSIIPFRQGSKDKISSKLLTRSELTYDIIHSLSGARTSSIGLGMAQIGRNRIVKARVIQYGKNERERVVRSGEHTRVKVMRIMRVHDHVCPASYTWWVVSHRAYWRHQHALGAINWQAA